jgi:DHA1 family tetracycline resistance protein-like MFS transporter
LARPGIGILLVLMFAQHVAFGGFEQLLALFTLTSLGLDASGNAVIFVFVGVIIVLVQGYFIGKWSRRFGDRALIYSGLALLAVGLFLTAFTPSQAVPWYSKASVEKSLNSSEVSSSVTVDRHALALPEETNKSWAGIVWLLIAMIPTAIGGGILQPSINSLLTKRVADNERGGMLGISSSFLSAANVIAPIMGGALFLAGNKVPFLVWSAIMGVLFLAALSLIKPGQKRNPARSLASSQLGHRDRQ